MTVDKIEVRQGALLDWRTEFRNAALESRYRRSMCLHDAQQLRHTMWIIATTFILFIIADHILLKSGGVLLVLTSIRCLVALSCLLLVGFVDQRPAIAHQPLPLNLVYFIILSGLLLTIYLRPGYTSLHISSLVVANLTIYLLIPNRLPWVLFWNGFLNAGFLLVTLWKPLEPGMLVSSVLILALANLMGWLTFSQLNRLQRRQFALLIEEREINRKLQIEMDERSLLEAQLRQMASTDPLTGIANRRHFFELAERELKRTARDGTPLSISMVDIDLFKTLNDRHGHAIGDLVLTSVADCCASVLRDTDLIGRYGGEEFVIALPRADLETAYAIAERLRYKVSVLELPMLKEDKNLSVTVGISQVEPGETQLHLALQRADAALYAGKARGRNCVVIAGETPSASIAEA